MVTQRTGGPRTGRPKKDGIVPFLQNPKRFEVTLLRATMGVMRQRSIRAAAKIIAAKMYSNQAGPESLPPDVREWATNHFAKMIKAHGPDGMMSVYGPDGRVVDKADGTVIYKNTMRGAKAATIEGAAELLRKLDRQAILEAQTNPGVARWLRCAVGGCIGVIIGTDDSIVAERFRNSGDPELEACWPGLVSFLNKPEQT